MFDFIDNSYFRFYLIGVAAFVILALVRIAILALARWITKENVLRKNLKKLERPDETPVAKKILLRGFVWFIEACFSWINVIAITFKTIFDLYKIIREYLTPDTEEIKALGFPLWNDPDLSSESVWAYKIALLCKSEQPQNMDAITDSAQQVMEKRPDFDYTEALTQLEGLDVVNQELISAAKSRLKSINITKDMLKFLEQQTN